MTDSVPRRQIAVYGGSFCPFHIGHLMVGAYVAQFVEGVSEVWYLLSALNPLKASYPVSDSSRWEALCKAISPYPFLHPCDIELSMPRPSYTIDTLRKLSLDYPDCHFTLLVGSDNILNLSRWRCPDEILSRFGILVYPRPGYDIAPAELPSGATLLTDAPQIEISSTFIRNAITAGLDMRPFLP
ncbi:MAG: nicotinate (nicotinamide) nucleotide adenylyltransferase [Pseudoflavonifractor sp.]|nr:nicotinate (nicotinamide) nucleotide adenylyltransferase [Alloprevotella sp.]MCM1116603.1 nicotinate (nicotinamide) nucleotide adenylyltransferase [Pseudoflavonifractor sp.]